MPRLAAERAIARQPVQRSVDALAALGLVALEPNPRHRRSRLVALTREGCRRLQAMERRQTSWTRRLAPDLSEASLRSATRLLRRIRARIQSHLSIPAPEAK